MKTNLDELAIFGSQPSFGRKLHVGSPNLGNRATFLRRLNDILDRRWLTNNGPCVRELESEIARLLGVRHCITMCNGTVGLEIAIRALDLHGEVIVPSFTFIATAHALRWQGITPVFCDINPVTHSLDPGCVRELINSRTTAILGVHLWGIPCVVTELSEIAQERGLALIFDAAHAFGCSCEGRPIGGFGSAEVFSFHATKFFNTFEGGAITTNNDQLAERIRQMVNFGFTDYDRVQCLGMNGKMSEICAAMGLTGLESLDDFLEVNYRNYKAYQRSLKDIPGLRLISYDESEQCNYQYIVIEMDDTVSPLNRDELKDILWAENILVRRYFYPGCHRMEPYQSLEPGTGQRLKVTERVAKNVLVLPTGTAISQDDINTICGLIRLTVFQAAEVSDRLRAPLQARKLRA